MSDIQDALRTIARELLLLEVEDLEASHKAGTRHINNIDGLGPILHPTEYRNALESGQIENAKLQNELVSHLLEARRVIEKFHPSVKLQIIGVYKLDEEGNAIQIINDENEGGL